jgi:hypothetical protein
MFEFEFPTRTVAHLQSNSAVRLFTPHGASSDPSLQGTAPADCSDKGAVGATSGRSRRSISKKDMSGICSPRSGDRPDCDALLERFSGGDDFCSTGAAPIAGVFKPISVDNRIDRLHSQSAAATARHQQAGKGGEFGSNHGRGSKVKTRSGHSHFTAVQHEFQRNELESPATLV